MVDFGPFPARLLSGTQSVVFEDIYVDGIKCGSHASIEDKEQQLFAPSVTTVAKTDAGRKDLDIGKKINLVDKVDLKKLADGKYEIVGTIMVKKTGEPLKENGEVVTKTMSLEINGADPYVGKDISIDNTFTFTTTDKMSGDALVVYEQVYRVNSDGSKTLVVAEEDINNEGQTVTVKKKDTPPTPRTGDTTPIVLVFAGLILSLGVLITLIIRKRRIK